MKFSGYQSAGRVNTNTPHMTAPSSNPLAYGAGGAGWNAAAKGLDHIAAVYEKKQEEEDTQDLMDARNKIMTSLTQQMYNSENGMFTTGYGENAKGLTDRVTEAVKNTTDDILSGYNSRVQKAARRHLSDNLSNFQRIAASRESSEAVKMKGVRYEEGLKNGAQLCSLNYNNDDMINTQLQTSLQLTTAMGQDMGMTGEQIAAKQRGVYTECVGNAVQAAIGADDYARARQLLDGHKTDMDVNAWQKLDNVVTKQQEKVDTYNLANSIYEETGGDIYSVREMAEQACTKDNGYFDVDKYDRIIARVNSLRADEKKAAAAGQRAARQRIEADVDAIITPEALEEYRAEHEGEWTEDEKYWFGLATDLQTRMYTAAQRGYKDKNAAADEKKLKVFELTLQNGGRMTAEKWVNIEAAAENLVENGRLSPAAMEDLYIFGGDSGVQSKLTEDIEQLGPAGAYNRLIQKGCEPDAAAVMISRVNDIYKSFDTDLDMRTPEQIAADELKELEE